MTQASAQQFVLIQTSGGAVALAADSIRPLRYVSNQPNYVPDRVVLEDGVEIPLVVVGPDVLHKLLGTAEPVTITAPTPDLEAAKLLADIQSILDVQPPPWPSSLTVAVDGSLPAEGHPKALSELSESLASLALQAQRAQQQERTRWTTFAQAVSELHRSYQQILDERDQLQRQVRNLAAKQ